jgi:carboxyl-terminal processing protease
VPGFARSAPPVPGTPITRQALAYVAREYVEPGLVDPRAMLLRALGALEERYPEVVADTADPAAAVVHVADDALHLDLAEAGTLEGTAALLEQLDAFAAPRLAAEGGEAPEYVALRGALAALDPHTGLLSPEQLRGFTSTTRGTFGGIGVTFSMAPDGIVVGEVGPGSPAAAAGLKTGEIIVAVGSTPAAGLAAAGAAELVRGEIGTTVVLTVRSAGGATRTVRIVRALISEQSVSARTLAADGAPPVLVVAVTRFQQETAAQLREALAGAPPGAAGIVLDLRGNPGGLLDAAIAVADRFLDSGVIVSIRGRGGRPQVFSATPFGIVEDRPALVVLINRGSASAAEVLAAALRHSRALVVGETSFGKGSVQQTYPLDDGGALLLTVRHYYTPGDVSIQSRGVDPDVLLTPVVVGERVSFGGAAYHPREVGLQNAFAPTGAPAAGPALRLDYLWEAGPAPAAPGLHLPPPAAPARADEDAAIRVAAAILRRAAGAGRSRAALLDAAAGVVATMAGEEERRIEAALARRGVDWSAGGSADATLGPAAAGDEPAEALLAPGATARLVVRVRNGGRGAARRVWGRTVSPNPLLANLDVVFGAIAPGETKEAGVDVAVPAGAIARWDPCDLEVREGDGPVVATVRGAARTLGGQRPTLAHALALADADPRGKRRGGDGTVQPGERLALRVRLLPPGAAAGAVDLRLGAAPAGAVSVERPLAQIAAGGDAAVLEAAVAAGAAKATLHFELQLSDRATGETLDDRIDVPVGRPLPVFAERRAPVVTADEAPPERSDAPALRLRVTVADETAVRDAFVLAGGRKVLYRRAGAAVTPRLPLEVEIPLAPGSNRIDVSGRDRDGLAARRTFFVYRTGGTDR